MPYSYIYCLFSGYLLGSIPAGYLLLKSKRKIDLRYAGSGNVGAMNAFDVTASKGIAVAVLLLDAAKGALAVILAWALFGPSFPLLSTSALAAVAGQNYPIWLGGKGGRGLATGAGALAVFCWVIPAVWIALWLILFAVSRHIHLANIIALMVTPVVLFVIPEDLYHAVLQIPADREMIFAAGTILCILILLRHRKPAMEIWKSRTFTSHTE